MVGAIKEQLGVIKKSLWLRDLEGFGVTLLEGTSKFIDNRTQRNQRSSKSQFFPICTTYLIKVWREDYESRDLKIEAAEQARSNLFQKGYMLLPRDKSMSEILYLAKSIRQVVVPEEIQDLHEAFGWKMQDVAHTLLQYMQYFSGFTSSKMRMIEASYFLNLDMLCDTYIDKVHDVFDWVTPWREGIYFEELRNVILNSNLLKTKDALHAIVWLLDEVEEKFYNKST